jgi:histone deacetylase 6
MDAPISSNAMDVDADTRSAAAAAFEFSPQHEGVHEKHIPRSNVGYAYSSEMLLHLQSSTSEEDHHPEIPERIKRIWELLQAEGCLKEMYNIPIRLVKKEEALLVHSESHWQKVLELQYMTDEQIRDSRAYYDSLSIYVVQGTTRAALVSCGAVIQACLAVATGHLRKSFAIVRPPGHHAEPDEHMGFCILNNVAVAAKVVQQTTSIKKILILDWDVHHGNGTQRAFEDDPSVLYISIHRYDNGDFYPSGNYGALESSGEGAGLGYSVNIPWPCGGMRDADYLLAFQKIVMPIALEFAPELVIISAGFDAAEGDRLGECHVSPAGYAHMTYMLAGLAGGKLVVALEGGYNVDAIAKSSLAVAKVLLGEPPAELAPMTAEDVGAETIWLVAKEQSKYWKNVDPKACEPRDTVEDISFSIPEILKAHRQYYMYTVHDMMQIPLLSPELDFIFNTQIMCSPDLFGGKKDTLLVFVHEFGNLRIELDAASMCDIDAEKSYLIDFSRQLMSWADESGFLVIDANLFPRPTTEEKVRPPTDKLGKNILLYLWDNYIQLCGAKKIILMGHGPGCLPIMHTIEQRSHSVNRRVKAVVQVVGHSRDPLSLPISSTDHMKQWFNKHSFVGLPQTHRALLSPQTKSKMARMHSIVQSVEEPRAERLIVDLLPYIKEFVNRQLTSRKNWAEDKNEV